MVVRRRLNITGSAIVFITTTVFEWKKILTQNNVEAIIIRELQKTQSLFDLNIISYVIMPSHIHLLLGFRDVRVLSKCMQSFKSITSRQIKQLEIHDLVNNNYRLWKPRFDDLIINSEKQLKVKIDYIHNNPVKAGLVESAEDWRYSSAVDWSTSREGLIKIDKDYKWLTKAS